MLQLDAAVIQSSSDAARHGRRLGLRHRTRAAAAGAQPDFGASGVDLSQSMLEVMRRKARDEGLAVECVRGNLVELGFLADAIADARSACSARWA